MRKFAPLLNTSLYLAQVPGGRAASYELSPLFMYNLLLFIEKYTDIFRVSLWWRGSGGGLSGRIFQRRRFSWGKRISMKGALDFQVLFKNNQKLNNKQFFQLKVRSNIKTNEQKLSRI